jgi:hypothetical protein
MHKIVVVIPVYRDFDEWEFMSLRQCCKVLGRYDVCLVAPVDLDTQSFHTICSSYGVFLKEECFSSEFFKNIQGYNRLLLSKEFYERFREYDYMLIYQLDAYVFEDKLEEWCSLGYDYVGAPIIGRYEENEYRPSMPMRVGNGGFSLRKIGKYLEFFSSRKNVFSSNEIIARIRLWKKPYTRVFVWLLMLLGWHNKPQSVAKHWHYNEDDFWSGYLDGSNYELTKPSVGEALGFAFEKYPSEMFKKTKALPFGCHAWRKYEYEDFWTEYIK